MNVGTAAITEIIWTLTGAVGLAVVLWAWYDAVADLHYVRARETDDILAAEAHQTGARGAVVQEALRALILAQIVMVGIVAMFIPPINPDTPVTRTGVAIAAGLIVVEVLIVVKALHARAVRRRVIQLLLQRQLRESWDGTERRRSPAVSDD